MRKISIFMAKTGETDMTKGSRALLCRLESIQTYMLYPDFIVSIIASISTVKIN